MAAGHAGEGGDGHDGDGHDGHGHDDGDDDVSLPPGEHDQRLPRARCQDVPDHHPGSGHVHCLCPGGLQSPQKTPTSNIQACFDYVCVMIHVYV